MTRSSKSETEAWISHDIRAVLLTVVPPAVKHAGRRQASSAYAWRPCNTAVKQTIRLRRLLMLSPASAAGRCCSLPVLVTH